MTLTIYYFSLALLGAEAQQSPSFPTPPVDLAARMANIPTCAPLPRTLPPIITRSGLVADVQQAGEKTVLDGINRIADKFPQTKCEARIK